MEQSIFELPIRIFQSLEALWTYLLLCTRLVGFFALVPGIGRGIAGLPVRTPAILSIALVLFRSDRLAPLPSDSVVMVASFVSELFLGGFIGLIPLLIVAGAQTAGQVASGSKGLTGAGMFDPATNSTVPDIGKIYGELSAAIFLTVGGHHVAIMYLASLSGSLTPGTFMVDGQINGVLVERFSHLFEIALAVSAPVIVSMLITNFVLGLITKAVPTVSIMAVSFPITILVGLSLTMLGMYEVGYYLTREMNQLERGWGVLLNPLR